MACSGGGGGVGGWGQCAVRVQSQAPHHVELHLCTQSRWIDGHAPAPPCAASLDPRRRRLTATPPSCAFHVCCAAISRSGPRATEREGSHTATLPSAAAVSSRSGPPGASLASGSMAVTPLPCAPLRGPGAGRAAAAAVGGLAAHPARADDPHAGAARATQPRNTVQCAQPAPPAAIPTASPQLGVDSHRVGADEVGGAPAGAHRHHRQQLRLQPSQPGELAGGAVSGEPGNGAAQLAAGDCTSTSTRACHLTPLAPAAPAPGAPQRRRRRRRAHTPPAPAG